MPVRRHRAEDQLQKSSLPLLLSCTALRERAVIKSVCVALRMEFLIVLSCGGSERKQWRKVCGGEEVFYTRRSVIHDVWLYYHVRGVFYLIDEGLIDVSLQLSSQENTYAKHKAWAFISLVFIVLPAKTKNVIVYSEYTLILITFL